MDIKHEGATAECKRTSLCAADRRFRERRRRERRRDLRMRGWKERKNLNEELRVWILQKENKDEWNVELKVIRKKNNKIISPFASTYVLKSIIIFKISCFEVNRKLGQYSLDAVLPVEESPILLAL